jgi:hypothetical protein
LSCDLCAIYNASAARGENSTGFHVAVAQQFTHAATLQHEGSEVSDPADQYRDSAITTAIIGYNFNKRFGVSVNVPYIHRSFRRAEGFAIDKGTESGLGDVSLLGRWIALSKADHDYSYSMSLMGGVEFPTGDSDRLREEVNEVEVPGAPPSGVHGNDLALGSGSYDAIIGAAANARWRRTFFTVDTQYFIRTRGDFGYRFGNEVSTAGGPGIFILFREETTLAVQAIVSYESKARDRLNGVKRNDGIITAWYAGPGIVFTWGEHFSATFNLDVPLEIQNREFQTVPDYRVRAGASWSF